MYEVGQQVVVHYPTMAQFWNGVVQGGRYSVADQMEYVTVFIPMLGQTVEVERFKTHQELADCHH
jgi:hypothetical protein